jgi:hypothetical protein
MEKALKDIPEGHRTMPAGVVSVPMGPLPGMPGDTKPIPEFFYRESVPPPEVLNPAPPPEPERLPSVVIPNFN